MNTLYITILFYCGILCGILGNSIYTHYKYTTFAVPKYQIGDCLDNGLYLEKITDIRKINYRSEALYIVRNIFIKEGGKHFGGLGSVTISYTDNYSIKIDNKNCEL